MARLDDRCVKNFGQLGWVSTQSVIELLRHLQAGEVPNLVIFYDGLNDTLAASSEGVAGAHQNLQQVASRIKWQATPNPVLCWQAGLAPFTYLSWLGRASQTALHPGSSQL